MSAGTLTLPIRESILDCKTGGMPSSASAKTNFLIYHPTGNKFVFLMLHLLTEMHVSPSTVKLRLNYELRVMYYVKAQSAYS